MKVCSFLTIVFLFMAVLMVVMSGCKYDVAEPAWDQPYEVPPTPTITQVDPSQATPGVNTITVTGTNFSTPPDTNAVYFSYFDNAKKSLVAVTAEVVATSTTSVTVRRPNLASDSCTVMVAPPKSLTVVKYSQLYKVDPVTDEYGNFNNNVPLNTVAVDDAENLYVIETTTRNIHKVTTDQTNSTLPTPAKFPPTDARIRNGALYITGTNVNVDTVNLATGAIATWVKLPTGKTVRFCDFDSSGNFYAGGTRTDLLVLKQPNYDVKAITYAGVYAKDTILAMRVYKGYIYLVVRTSAPAANNPATAIWRHSVDANGNLGSRDLVVDWTTTGGLASRSIRGIAFSSKGNMFIGTDASADPILILDLNTKIVDYFYRGILPSYCRHLNWGSGNYLYMVRGNTSQSQKWTIYRVNMGATVGAP